MLELKDEREIYLVDQSLLSELPDEVVPRMLFTAINRQDVVFLWPVPLPKEDGRILEWHRSLMQAAEMAIKKWVRVNANMSLGAYEVSEATGALPEPGWPDQGFVEILEAAFRDRYIRDLDHPALQRLKGVV